MQQKEKNLACKIMAPVKLAAVTANLLSAAQLREAIQRRIRVMMEDPSTDDAPGWR